MTVKRQSVSTSIKRYSYLVQVEPVPDDADEEADGEQSAELDEPGDRRPQLSADDNHYDHDTRTHLEDR